MIPLLHVLIAAMLVGAAPRPSDALSPRFEGTPSGKHAATTVAGSPSAYQDETALGCEDEQDDEASAHPAEAFAACAAGASRRLDRPGALPRRRAGAGCRSVLCICGRLIC